ncbi:hypothetical protein Tco_1346025 [Tanacetum coccineum]
MAYSYFELPRPLEIVNQETSQLGMKIIRDQSGNTLRLSQSKFYNEKLVQTLLEGHSILSLEGNLSGDCDVEKNGKWSCIYTVGSQEYQMVCTRLNIASADVGMLDKFDRRLLTDVQVFVDFDYAMRRSVTVMEKNVYLVEHCARKDPPIRPPMGIGAGLMEHLTIMERPDKIPIRDRGSSECCLLIGFGDGVGRPAPLPFLLMIQGSAGS